MRTYYNASLSLVFLIAFLGNQAFAVEPAVPSRVEFANVRVFNGASARLSPPTNVVVVGNSIADISDAPLPQQPAPGVIRIQGNGRTLMPGLIDVHVHVLMSASSQADLLNPAVTEETLQARASAEAKQLLLRGFTAVRDCGGPMLADRKAIDQGKVPGPESTPAGR